jgi:acyl-coenzyme A synthetase/AMP-(fatty) acid ligase
MRSGTVPASATPAPRRTAQRHRRPKRVAAEALAYLAERVAPYKRVRRYEILEGIPRTPSGKIVRRGLIERERSAPQPMHR